MVNSILDSTKRSMRSQAQGAQQECNNNFFSLFGSFNVGFSAMIASFMANPRLCKNEKNFIFYIFFPVMFACFVVCYLAARLGALTRVDVKARNISQKK